MDGSPHGSCEIKLRANWSGLANWRYIRFTLLINLFVSKNRKVNETYLEVEVCLTFYRPRAPTKVK